MGRPSHGRALAIWANGLRVGRWVVPAAGPMELSYDPSWVASDEARPISLSLPFNLDGVPIKGDRVGFFFDNLLPDSQAVRQRVRARFHTRSGDAFDLLEAIGRDCAGALQLLPEDESPVGTKKIAVTPMLAATDGHATNLSIRLLAGGRYRLTPLYDVLSAWPVSGPRANQVHPKKLKLAMALRGAQKHYRIADIGRRHFNATARLCGLGKDMNSIIDDVVERTPRVIDDVGARLPYGFPMYVFDAITKGAASAIRRI